MSSRGPSFILCSALAVFAACVATSRNHDQFKALQGAGPVIDRGASKYPRYWIPLGNAELTSGNAHAEVRRLIEGLPAAAYTLVCATTQEGESALAKGLVKVVVDVSPLSAASHDDDAGPGRHGEAGGDGQALAHCYGRDESYYYVPGASQMELVGSHHVSVRCQLLAPPERAVILQLFLAGGGGHK